MRDNSGIQTLLAEIDNSISVLNKIETFYKSSKISNEDREESVENAIVLSEIISNYYTCLETLFFRISSFFENNLSKDKWHSDLLKRMILDIEGIRERVISDESFEILDELKKFRHFKRYYFQFNYSWDKLGYLEKIFLRLTELIKKDLDNFNVFLNKLY